TLRIRSTSGAVWVDSTTAETEIRTISGDIVIADAHRGRVRLDSVSGHLAVTVHPGTRSAVALTSVSGRVHSDLAVRRGAPDGGMPGPPELDIAMRSVSGNVELRSRPGPAGA